MEDYFHRARALVYSRVICDTTASDDSVKGRRCSRKLARKQYAALIVVFLIKEWEGGGREGGGGEGVANSEGLASAF